MLKEMPVVVRRGREALGAKKKKTESDGMNS